MQRVFLREARELKGWTLEEAAEYVGVTRNTIWRWEQGISTPYTYHTDRLCRAYGLSRAELGLPDRNPRKGSPAKVKPLLKPQDTEQQALEAACTRLRSVTGENLHLRFSYLLDDWLLHARFTGSLADLQSRVSREVESYDTMKQDHPNHGGIDEGRRNALRTLALIPLQALGLGIVASSTKHVWAPEEMLPHCAAGIIACYQLAKGQHEDLVVAFDAITGYLPTLQKIVKESSVYREQAAQLAAQCLHLKAILGLHYEGANYAADYARQALMYAETAEDLPLQLTILDRQIWIAICSRQVALALNATLRIQSLLEHPTKPIPPLILSLSYSKLAEGQAFNNKHKEAQAALVQMYDSFVDPTEEESLIYAEFNRGSLSKSDGKIHYYLGKYDEAFQAIAQIVDLKTLALTLPATTERGRIEIINYLTLTALKRPNKDKELIVPLWTAGMQGARNLRSEQRYEEAMTAYGIMEALWSDDAQIRDLRDLMGHW